MDDESPAKKRSPSAGIPKRVSDAEWERWIAAFREYPGQTTRVAEIMGVPRNRARIAWHHGWPKQGRPPISELLEADKVLARAKRAEMQAEQELEEAPVPEEESAEISSEELASDSHRRVMAAMLERDKMRQRALADSARTRAEEGTLISVTRKNTMALGVVTAQLLRGAQVLSGRIAAVLQSQTDIPLKEGVAILQKAAVMTRLGTEAAKMAVQMERLAMGEPIGDEANVGSGKLSPAEAERWLTVAMRTLQRSRTRRGLGGSDEDQSRSVGSAEPDAGERVPGDVDDALGIARIGRTDLN